MQFLLRDKSVQCGKWPQMALLTFGLSLAGTFLALGQTSPSPNEREVKGQTIVSKALPKAELTFGNELQYVGNKRVDLYGNAEADIYVFARPGDAGIVDRFYWVQFEHFLPTNTRTYDYSSGHSTQVGAMSFAYDIKSWPDYAAMQAKDPMSDGAAVERLLAEHSLSFPKRAVRVRMFHFPTPDRRSELMIIYGEALPDTSSVPVRENGVQLDQESPEGANVFLEHARNDLKIHIP